MKLNNVVRTITKNKKFPYVTCFYKKLYFLKLKDVYKLELAKFMHKLFHNKHPNVFETKILKLIDTILTKPENQTNQITFFSRKQNCLSTQIKLPRSQAME